MIEQIITALISGALTGTITVISMKKDVEWMKSIMRTFDKRITFLERKI